MEYAKKIINNSSRLKDKLILIKLPSSIMVSPRLLKEFVDDIDTLRKCGAKIFIVHEYEDLLKKKLQDFNLSHDGDRPDNMPPDFLNSQTAELYEIIISGYISKFLVRVFNKYSVSSIGISGKDGNLVVTERPARYIHKGDDRLICNVVSVNPEIIFAFETMSIVTIISPIAVDKNAHTSIVNVDDMIAKIASNAGFDYIIYIENGIKKLAPQSMVNSPRDLQSATTRLYLNNNLIKAGEIILQNIPANIYFIDADKPHPIVTTLIDN